MSTTRSYLSTPTQMTRVSISAASSCGSHVAVQGFAYRSQVGPPKLIWKSMGNALDCLPLSVAVCISRIDSQETFELHFPGADIGTLPRYAFAVGDVQMVEWLTGENLGYGRCTVLIAQSEKEHMERYLSKTDSPIYDLLEVLRYHPDTALSPTLKRVARGFTEASVSSSTPE